MLGRHFPEVGLSYSPDDLVLQPSYRSTDWAGFLQLEILKQWQVRHASPPNVAPIYLVALHPGCKD